MKVVVEGREADAFCIYVVLHIDSPRVSYVMRINLRLFLPPFACTVSRL